MTTATIQPAGFTAALADIPRLRLSVYLAVLFLEITLLVGLGII